MQEYVLRNWSIVRSGTSAGQKALFFNLRWLRAKLERAGGSAQLDNATRDEIATALKVSPADVSAMAQRLGGFADEGIGAIEQPVERPCGFGMGAVARSEEHTSELQSLMRISYAVFCLKKKKTTLRYDTFYLEYTK